MVLGSSLTDTDTYKNSFWWQQQYDISVHDFRYSYRHTGDHTLSYTLAIQNMCFKIYFSCYGL